MFCTHDYVLLSYYRPILSSSLTGDKIFATLLYFENSEEIFKACIEVFLLADHEAYIDSELLKELGLPPYIYPVRCSSGARKEWFDKLR